MGNENTVGHVVQVLDQSIPLAWQESYDNCGLLVGDRSQPVKGVLLCLDVTLEVLHEAIERKCNMIVAHHPLIFKPLKQITGQGWLEKTILFAIKHDIAIYAAHTNIDNAVDGVSALMAEKLQLTQTRILSPKKGLLKKIEVFVPLAHADTLVSALGNAGAGKIGQYKDCSFSVAGEGSFLPLDGANPFIGTPNQLEKVDEKRIEMVFPSHLESQIVAAMRLAHPYEEIAYFIIPLDNTFSEVGSGVIGELNQEVQLIDFLDIVKEKFKIPCIRHTTPLAKKIKKVALCGGSGVFLLKTAIRQGADIFLTGDVKYHDFFDADGQIVLADIGHFESEQFTPEIFFRILSEKFANIALILSSTPTNPVLYHC